MASDTTNQCPNDQVVGTFSLIGMRRLWRIRSSMCQRPIRSLSRILNDAYRRELKNFVCFKL